MRITSSTLEKLISQDYTITGNGGRWASTSEHDSLVIDRDNGTFYWNSKDLHGNALDWLIKIKGYPYTKAVDILSALDYEYPIHLKPRIEEEVIVVPELVESFWNNGKYRRDYWHKRCLRDSTIDTYKLGFYNNWFTMPVFVNEKFRNFQLRKDDPKEIKYYYKGIGPTLVNSDILKYVDWVVITEGTVDALLLMQEGVPAISHTGGANGWNYNWYKYFNNVKRIYYIADNDYAGIKGAERIARMDQNKIKIFQFTNKKEKYDVVDYFRDGRCAEELKELLPKESKYLFQL